MQLRAMIGQMLVMGFNGCEVDESSPITEWVQQDNLGGVLLFDYDIQTKQYGKNLKNLAQIKQLNTTLKEYARHSKANIDGLELFTAIDYEGGDIDRLASVSGSRVTKKPCEQVLLSDEGLYEEAQCMALMVKSLGFNLNFAPVVDLNLNDKEGIIGKKGRSFSAHPDEVMRAARLFVEAFNHNGMVCAYKHFPGHGSARGDTHEGFVDVTDTFHEKELIPYQNLCQDSGSNMIMTAHVVNRRLDPTGLPATLSSPILTDILRRKFHFKGVIISDDLQMHAISHHYSLDEALQLTINAGSDMLIFGNQFGAISASEVIERIEKLVRSGRILPQRIEESYCRIRQLKKFLTSRPWQLTEMK